MKPVSVPVQIAVGVLFASAAFATSLILEPYLAKTFVLLFVLAVLGASGAAGIVGGLTATALSIPAIDILWLEPTADLRIVAVEDVIVLLIFTVVSVTVSRLVSAARVSRERLQYALELATDGFWDWNLRTDAVYFSPRWIASLGYGPRELAPNVESWRRLLHPEDVERTMAAVREHLESRTEMYEVENRLLTKAGTWRSNLDRGKVIARDRNGRPLRMIGFDVDISERKRAEEDALARRAAEARDAAKDQFISLVSHELRNPLSSISLAVKLLRSKCAGPQAAVLAVDSIERSVKQQLMLINDLLDWSRFKHGKFRLNLQPVDLERVLDSAWDVVREEAARKHIERETEVAPGTERITGDPDRLRQVFWNLFANAVKFTPAGGRVSVRTRADHGVTVSVADTGRGVPKESLDRLFDPYWQSAGTDSAEHKGLGLGLSITKRIVESHGGTIEAQSEGPGRGTTFTVHLG